MGRIARRQIKFGVKIGRWSRKVSAVELNLDGDSELDFGEGVQAD